MIPFDDTLGGSNLHAAPMFPLGDHEGDELLFLYV